MTDIIFHRSQSIEGYGIYQSSFFGLKEAVNYIIFQMWLIDTDSGKDIARTQKNSHSSRQTSRWLKENDQISEDLRLHIKESFD